jgi:hypothetical protein
MIKIAQISFQNLSCSLFLHNVNVIRINVIIKHNNEFNGSIIMSLFEHYLKIIISLFEHYFQKTTFFFP